ncbi:MAG: choice-of-anchor Q domain-containing protein [Planctomycetota bacterium]|jgi:predicted outer membrane repeat protein
MKERVKILVILIIALVMVSPSTADIIFVDADAAGANDGSSWADAFNSLQDALAVAQSGDEIRAAEGIYKPDHGVGIPPNYREATIQLKNDVAIKGGYAGFSEPDPDTRDIKVYESILSGDLASNDVDVNDASDLPDEARRAENSYHVVTYNRTGSTLLDGFTITGGNANGPGYPIYHNRGGGMYNLDGRPTLANCTFTRNYANWRGGGMYNSGISIQLINCDFTENMADYGGGISNFRSNMVLYNCMFRNNSSVRGGGGMYNQWSSSLILTSCIFSDNSSGSGGGIFNIESSSRMTNCIFSGNRAKLSGGGIYVSVGLPGPIGGCFIDNPSNVTLISCTFAENLAEGGRALACTSCNNQCPSNIQIANSIFYDGGDEIRNYDNSTITVNYSNIEGGWTGEGNIDSDPCFNQPGCWEPPLPSPPPLFKASAPNPANRGIDVSITSDLSWNAGHDAVSHDVYFGISSPPPFIHNQTSTTFDPFTMTYNTMYYWRIDEINEMDITNGDIWSFTTKPPPQFKASEPNPADGAMNVSLTADLSWTSGHDAVSHDVYFGISYPPPFIHNQTSTTFDPGTMAYGTTYYWRIDEVNDLGKTIGDIWNFTTLMSPPPILTQAASYMNDIQQYIWIEGDYHLLPGSPCIDAGDPNYIAGSNETDLDGRPRVMGGRIDMGAYETPIPAEVRIIPRTINLASKGNRITCYIWLSEEYNVADIEPNSVFLEGQIQGEPLYIDEQQQVATARFSREEVQAILDVGDVELTISGQLKDGNIFEGTDVIRVVNEGRGKN